jgi:hypothetical protein
MGYCNKQPKDRGGVGIINTKIMNECLLVKWIWNIVKGCNDISYTLLKVKYMPDVNSCKSRSNGTVLLNFSKFYTKLNTCSNGGPCMSKSKME